MRRAKKWWKSKTLWFNTLSGLVTTLAAAKEALPPAAAPWVVVGITAGNFLLRLLTKEPVEK